MGSLFAITPNNVRNANAYIVTLILKLAVFYSFKLEKSFFLLCMKSVFELGGLSVFKLFSNFLEVII